MIAEEMPTYLAITLCAFMIAVILVFAVMAWTMWKDTRR